MFETTPTQSLLGQVRSHDFDAEPVIERDATRIDAIRELDRVIRAAQAEQTAQVAALLADRTRLMVGTGDPCLSVIGEVAMARNVGPTAAASQLSLAIGAGRLPHVFELFHTGTISEATFRAVVTQTQSLHVDDQVVADGEIASVISGMTTAQARDAAARVSMHPETDGVATLQVRGPAEQITAAFKTLDDWATGLRSTGDPRTRGQIMCQTLVERVTGLAHADDICVEVNLVLDAETFVAGGDTPVELDGYGPISP